MASITTGNIVLNSAKTTDVVQLAQARLAILTAVADAPAELHRDESTQPVPPLSSANATDKDDYPDDPVSDDQEIDFSPPDVSLTSTDDVSLASQSEIDYGQCSKDSAAGHLIARVWPLIWAERERRKGMTPEELEREEVEHEEAMERAHEEWIKELEMEYELAKQEGRLGGNSDE